MCKLKLTYLSCPFPSLPQLMDVVRSNYEAMIDRAHGGPNFMMHSGISQASEYDDPPGLREKAEYLLREWVNLYHSAAAGRDSTKAFSAFVGQVNTHLSVKVITNHNERSLLCLFRVCLSFLLQMHQQGILKTDDLITRFFRLCTEMCVEISYRAQAEQQHNPAASAAIIRAKCYHNLDAFVRLIALLVKHSGEATNTVTKINLLNKVHWHENNNITPPRCVMKTFQKKHFHLHICPGISESTIVDHKA